MDVWRKLPILSLLLVSTLLVVLLGWLSSIPVTANFPDLVTERAYFEDTAGQETIQTVQNKPFKPFDGPLFLGNNNRPVWMRVTLAASNDPNWVLQLQPSFTHHIEVWTARSFEQSANRAYGWQQQVIGVQHPFRERAIKTLTPSVHVEASAASLTVVYVKIQTPTTPIAVRALSTTDNAYFNSLMHLMAGVLLGVGILMMSISFLVYQITKDPLWAADSVFNALGIITMMFQLGLASSLLLPMLANSVGRITLMLNAVYFAYVCFFYFLILRTFQMPRWVLSPYLIVVSLLPVLLVLVFFNQGDFAMSMNNGLIAFVTVWSFVVILNARHHDPVILWTFRIGYFFLNAYSIAIFVPIKLQIQSANEFALYPNLPVNLFVLLIFMLILARNTQLKFIENQRLLQENRDALTELNAARKHHEETSSFFGMLLHEIKNPLSAIRMTVANLQYDLNDATESVKKRLQRVHMAVDTVDNVLERGVEIDQLVQGSVLLSPATLDLGQWLIQLYKDHPETNRLTRLGPDHLTATVDVQLLDLMVKNLIDNAVKYAAKDSSIVCHLQHQGSRWMLSISNEVGSVGFPDAEKLFTKYYRASQVMHLGGLGLGLYWVRGIARLMHGDVTYQQQPNRVVFSLWLPI